MIDSKETVDWIRELEQKFIRKDTKENMDQFDKNNDNFLAFREFLDLVGLRENEKETKDYKDEVHKFGICDQNKDGYLTFDELSSYLHPEFFERTRKIYVEANFDDFDQNKNGQIDSEEYLREHLRLDPDSNSEDELEDFREIDSDSNGYLDMNEVTSWLFPTDYDPA